MEHNHLPQRRREKNLKNKPWRLGVLAGDKIAMFFGA